MAPMKMKEQGGNGLPYIIYPGSRCKIGDHTYYFAAEQGNRTGRLCVESRISAKAYDDWRNYTCEFQLWDWRMDTYLLPESFINEPKVTYWIACQPLCYPGMTLVPYTQYIRDQIGKPNLLHHLQHMLEILAQAERYKVDCNVLYIPETEAVLIHPFPGQAKSKIIAEKIKELSKVLQACLQEKRFKSAVEVYERFAAVFIDRRQVQTPASTGLNNPPQRWPRMERIPPTPTQSVIQPPASQTPQRVQLADAASHPRTPTPQYQTPQYPTTQKPAPQYPLPRQPAPQYPTPRQPAPQQSAPQQPAPQKPTSVHGRPGGLLSARYRCFKVPEIGAATMAVSRATNTRVLVERHDGNKEQLRKQVLYCEQLQKRHPVPPRQGLCLLQEVVESTKDDSFLVIRDVMDTTGFLPVGHPVLLALPLRDRLVIARNMLSVMDHIIQAGWLPTQMLESHMLVDSAALEVCFVDGHLLHRDPPGPLVCTLGYQAPRSFSLKQGADLSAVSYAMAVWLYRLFIGGYPLEGRRTLAMLREAHKPEREMAGKLYGSEAVFTFDNANQSNRPDPNCKRHAEQAERWRNTPSQLRTGWEQTFGECLHHSEEQRWTPRQWLTVVNAQLDE